MTDNPRPTCPECGRTVNPTTAIIYPEAKTIAERVLEGVYCHRADCILDAIARGWPADRAKRV